MFSITSLFSQSSWNTNFVGHWGVYGGCGSIDTDGDHVYICEDDQFVIRDVSDPLRPFETGSLFMDRINKVMLHDGNAFISGFFGVLHSVDISNPVSPKLLGLATVADDNFIHDFCVINNYAYLACGEGGLNIYDISDPENMQMTSVWDSVYNSYSIAVSDQYAYLIDFNSIQIIDVSNPLSPFLFSIYNLEIPDNYMVKSINIYNNYAYVSLFNSGLIVLDIGDPANIIEVNTYFQDNFVYDIKFSDQQAYLSARDTGFLVLDIADPANISIVGGIDISSGTIAINDQYVYTGGYGYRIINVQNPAAPFEIIWNYTPDEIWDVDIKDNYAFLSAGDSGMRVVDISEKSKPLEIGHFNTNSRLFNLEIENEYAFLPAFDTGLYILNISQVESPVEVGFVEIDFAYDIKVRNGYGFLTNSYGGDLIILDVNDPGNPAVINKVSTPGSTLDIVLQDNYAFIASDEYGLTIVDISDPASPFETGRFDDGMMSVFGVDVSGDFAYLSSPSYGIIIVDISHKYNPFEVGRYEIYESYTIKVKSSIAYVTGYFMGMHMIDVSAPANPFEVGSYTFGNEPYTSDIAFKDEEIFISAHDDGLLIVHDWLITSTEEIHQPSTTAVTVHPIPASILTTFNFEIKKKTEVSLNIYNERGQLIETLEKQSLSEGNHEIKLDVAAFPSGLYYYKLVTGKDMHSGKFLVVN